MWGADLKHKFNTLDQNIFYQHDSSVLIELIFVMIQTNLLSHFVDFLDLILAGTMIVVLAYYVHF